MSDPTSHLGRSAKRLALATLLAASMAAIAACGGGSEQPQPSESPTASPSVTASASSSASEPAPSTRVAPLTGLPVAEEVTSRPFAVMINNLKPARPQSGLTQADTVWEVLAEGGITRLVAIFQSKEFTDPIGPIRSIRPYYIEIGDLYGGVFVHAGASNDGFAILRGQHKYDMDEITNAGAYFYRDKSRKAPHNVYSTLEKLRAGRDKLGYPDTHVVPYLPFSSAPDLAGALPATDVTIRFLLKDYKVSYAYDAAKGTYARSINGEPHVDKNNNEQLTASNLVVIRTKHVILDDVGRLEVDLKSGGEAVLLQQGKAVACQWVRDGDMVRLMKDGRELPFLPGVTYYHVVPNTKAMDGYLTYQ